MIERKLASTLNDFREALKERERGNISDKDLLERFHQLRNSIGSIVARYCDDFSSVEYHDEIKEMELFGKKD